MRKGEFAMRAQNLTLLTDLYELTMMQGYYENPSDQIRGIDVIYRKIHAAAHTPYVQDLSR